jgi:hypothetical protein
MVQSLGNGTLEKHPIKYAINNPIENPIECSLAHYNLTHELKNGAVKIDHCHLRWFGTKLA